MKRESLQLKAPFCKDRTYIKVYRKIKENCSKVSGRELVNIKEVKEVLIEAEIALIRKEYLESRNNAAIAFIKLLRWHRHELSKLTDFNKLKTKKVTDENKKTFFVEYAPRNLKNIANN